MEIGNNLTEKAKRDYQLIKKALEFNDQRAYTELMESYRESLFFMMLKMTNDPIDAEDVTIEAFGKAFKSLDSYTPDYGFSTWLFKIATNNCIDFLRKKNKNSAFTDSMSISFENHDNFGNLQTYSPDPEEIIINKQKKQELRKIVSKLKPHYQTLVELRYFKEYSYEEISKELSLPIGTVKAKLFRARDLLYQILKDKKTII